jgi:hypothetical protein
VPLQNEKLPPIDYGFSSWPWQPGCWHWQVISTTPAASEQAVLQYVSPSAGIQLQAGCLHLDFAFMGAPLVERALLSEETVAWRNWGIALRAAVCSALERISPRTLDSIAPKGTTLCPVLLIIKGFESQ